MIQTIKRVFRNPAKYLSARHLLWFSIGGRLFVLWMRIARCVPFDKMYLKVFYLLSMHEKLDLKNPKTFTQKIQWLKLHNTNPQYSCMVDKYQARNIIKDKLGEGHLIPLLGAWNSIEEIDFEALPNAFVLKTTHDSGTVIIAKSKEGLDRAQARKKLSKALRTNYFYKSREYPYKHAVPRIIAEQYMHDETQTELTDYKFFCFHGVPRLLQITANKGADKSVGYFDMEFNPMPFHTGQGLTNPSAFQKPADLGKMIEIARLLSQNIIHVRIDLYYINSRIYFGEFTFHHNGGIVHFSPPVWNKILGDMIVI